MNNPLKTLKESIIILLFSILLLPSGWAQSPEKMSYQAVIRNSTNQLVSNQQISIQISILQGSADGTAVYVETHSPTTNTNGLASLEVGSGTVLSGDFSTIDWSQGPYFIKTETDPTGGNNYTITGTSQLLSVPYALHAKTAENVTGTIAETDPVFTSWNKDYNDLTNTPVIPTIPQYVSSFINNAGYLTAETDPLFSRWSKDYNDLINKPTIPTVPQNVSAFTNDAAYLSTETDPLFSAWSKDYNDLINKPAIPTVPQNVSSFTNDAGYLSTETDPLFSAWSKDYNDLTNKPIIPTVPQNVSVFTNDAGYLSTETDPVFSAWSKDYNDLINKPIIPTVPQNVSVFTNDAGYLSSETDPVFSSSLAHDISASDTTRWGKARWSISGNDIYYASGKVGIGISTPEDIGSAPLNVEGGILYKGGVTGGGAPGKLFYDPSGNGTFKYYDNTNTEQVLGTGEITYDGSLWSSRSGDIVSYNDVMCQSSLAVGIDVIPGVDFGYSTILLRENNLRIRFDDTSSSSGFPANDWQLTANDAANGGSNYFAIEDITGATVPFKVMAGAKDNALYVSSDSRLGINTSTPALDIHILSGNTPGIRFDQDASNGKTAYTWDVVASEANLSIRDVTGGSKLPFCILSGAPDNSLTVSSSGNVGIGTNTPTQKLDVQGVMHLQPTTEPASPSAGDIYFDSTSNKLRCYDGTEWHDLWQ